MTSRKIGPLHLRDWGGAGLPTILTHGMAAHTYWWDPVVPHLTGILRPVAFDFQGHGDSDWLESGEYTSPSWVANIEAVRRELGFEKFLLVGHSMGARIALDYATVHGDRLLGVVAIDFLPEFYASRDRQYAKTRARAQPVYDNPEAMIAKFRLQPPGTTLGPEELRVLGRQGVKRHGAAWTWKFDWRAFGFPYGPVWPQLPGIAPRTLIIRGEYSPVMTREIMDKIVTALPRGEAAEVPGAHHHVPLDKPAELAAAIGTFAASLGTP